MSKKKKPNTKNTDTAQSIHRLLTWKTIAGGIGAALVISIGVGAGLGYMSSRQKPETVRFDMSPVAQPLGVGSTENIQGATGTLEGARSQSSISTMLQPAGTYDSADDTDNSMSTNGPTGTALQGTPAN